MIRKGDIADAVFHSGSTFVAEPAHYSLFHYSSSLHACPDEYSVEFNTSLQAEATDLTLQVTSKSNILMPFKEA